MFWIGLQFVAAACIGYLAAEAGRVVHQNSTNVTTRRELALAVRYRALVLSCIIGGGPVMVTALSSGGISGTLSILCLGASLAVSLLGTIGWLHLVMNYGQRDIETGEIVLVLVILPFAFLYVCGILWITLGILFVVAAAGGGLYLYRTRMRTRA